MSARLLVRADRRFWIVLMASLLWGLLVAGVFHRLAAGGSRSRAVRQRPLVVATELLPVGAVVSRGSVRLRQVPDDLFPAGGAARVEDVAERPVISPIQAGEAVVEARLAARGSGLGLAPMIPAGMRAVAVRVNDVAGVAGFVLPGMRVDVLATGRPPGRADMFTRTVLQNIVVLSAGQTTQTDGKNAAMNVPVVTLLVDPGQAEVLTLAAAEARIQLVLRNSQDQHVVGTHGSQTGELFGAAAVAPAPVDPEARRRKPPAPARAAPPQQATAPPPDPAANQVLVIRGNSRSLESAAPKAGEIR